VVDDHSKVLSHGLGLDRILKVTLMLWRIMRFHTVIVIIAHKPFIKRSMERSFGVNGDELWKLNCGCARTEEITLEWKKYDIGRVPAERLTEAHTSESKSAFASHTSAVSKPSEKEL
jgi:hypothetical protein